jgi:hypothetical protein
MPDPRYEAYVNWRQKQKGMPVLSYEDWLGQGQPGPQNLRQPQPPITIPLPETSFPPAPPSGPTPGGPDDPKLIERFASIREIFRRHDLDLESLHEWAWQKIVEGASPAQIELELYERQEFRDRFAAIFEFRKRFPKLTPPSPVQVLEYETTAAQLYRAAGLPVGFYDQPQDFVNLIGGGTGMAELAERVNEAIVKMQAAPAEARAFLEESYGIGIGQLAAAYLDPGRALPLIRKEVQAAFIGGAGTRTGFGVSRTEAERLGDLGITEQQAEAGFGTLVGARELFRALPGMEAAEREITREEQLAGTFEGSEFARERIRRRARERQARFQGGGGFTTSARGVVGLGTAST